MYTLVMMYTLDMGLSIRLRRKQIQTVFLRGLELLARKRTEVELHRVLDGGPCVASGRTPP